jgi:hypothetical protein
MNAQSRAGCFKGSSYYAPSHPAAKSAESGKDTSRLLEQLSRLKIGFSFRNHARRYNGKSGVDEARRGCNTTREKQLVQLDSSSTKNREFSCRLLAQTPRSLSLFLIDTWPVVFFFESVYLESPPPPGENCYVSTACMMLRHACVDHRFWVRACSSFAEI